MSLTSLGKTTDILEKNCISIIVPSNSQALLQLRNIFSLGLVLRKFLLKLDILFSFIFTLCYIIAARMREAANEKAEAEKILQIKKAEGDAESKYLSGLGIARQRQAIVDGLRDSVLAFSENVPGTTSKDVMDMVLVTQYFDTLKEIGASSKSNSVFVPHGPGAVRDIASQFRDSLLQGKVAQS